MERALCLSMLIHYNGARTWHLDADAGSRDKQRIPSMQYEIYRIFHCVIKYKIRTCIRQTRRLREAWTGVVIKRICVNKIALLMSSQFDYQMIHSPWCLCEQNRYAVYRPYRRTKSPVGLFYWSSWKHLILRQVKRVAFLSSETCSGDSFLW